MKKLIAILLALTLLLCSTVAFATADNEEESRQSNYFASYGTSLSAIGGGKIKVTFTCSAVDYATTLGVVNYIVQRKNSSGNWEDASGWLSGKTGSNVHTYSFSKTIYGNVGTTYRVRCIFICTKNSTSETKSYTSGSKKAT
ncbi:MAG: hypothetical protein E7337_13565 [Clostridiales bacterium]|nr:hypothetical protein [Clostridiales bacterium]